MIDFDKLIKTANEMAPLPASAIRLARLVNDPDAGIDEIAEVVAFDQALTVRMLRMANSAFSASATVVTDVREAVLRLGAAQVLAFAIGINTRAMMQRPIPAYAIGENELWKHSVRSALAIELMPRLAKRAVPPPAFTAALLHDVGKLVMDRFLTADQIEMLERAKSEGRLTMLEAEAEILEVNHAELGGIVAQHWNLPEPIVHGIIYHHQPERVAEEVPDLVYLANLASKYRVPASGDEPPPPDVEPGVTERTGLDGAFVNRLGAAIEERFDEVFERYEAGA